MKPKPILVINTPFYTAENHNDIQNHFDEKIKDYHVLVVSHTTIKTPEIQVFYEKDITKIKYEELKEMVLNKSTEKA